MDRSSPQTHEVVRGAILAAFGEIARKTGSAPTHLDMRLRLEDGTDLQVSRKPLAEGGSGNIEITDE